MKVKVTVTEQHIKRGKKSNTNFCPIALALKGQLGLRSVVVDGDVVEFGVDKEGDGGFSINLPVEAQEFVRAFDDGETVKPFSFTL